MPAKSVSLLLFSKDPGREPGKIEGCFLTTYERIWDTANDIMLQWDSGDRYVKTYEVLYSPDGKQPYKRLNSYDLISTAFIHRKPKNKQGYYKVRAVDYWGRTGKESKVIRADH
jgi:hypothetical protein